MSSGKIPALQIGEYTADVPIVQGGMGVGISLAGLASAVGVIKVGGDSDAEIYYLIPHPIINYAWEAQLISYNSFWATYTIQLLLENEGSENAENMYIWYGSDAGNDKFYSQIMSDPFDIPQNSKYVGTATLTVPRGVVTQFNIKIWGDNIEPIEIYSDILET